MIYVINSARYSVARHIIADYESGHSVFLIVDECHHYGSKENYKIFDFLPVIAGKLVNFYSLGMSATPETPVGNENLNSVIGGEIYRYSVADALASDIICDFIIFNVQLEFTEEEKFEYDDYTDKLAKLYSKIVKLLPWIGKIQGELFFAELRNIAASEGTEAADIAEAYMLLIHKRTELIHFAAAKKQCAGALVKSLRKDSRVIVFGERIEAAEAIYSDLREMFPGQVGKYHSLMSAQEKRNVMRRYQNYETRVLVSCRALDEGLNIPETDIGIIVSSTQADRQRIQRLGRILRRKDAGHTAKLYYLYIGDSNEHTEFLNLTPDSSDKIKTYSISYDAHAGRFSFPEYEYLSKAALKKISVSVKDNAILAELRKNIDEGMINGDFLMTEESCMEKIKSAAIGEERNYYIAMLYVIRAHK